MRFFVTPILMLALLTGCGQEAEPVDSSNTGGTAEGDVLGGSISDDMLPLDQLQSQSPALEPTRPSTPDNAASEDAQEETAEPDATAGSAAGPVPASEVPPEPVAGPTPTSLLPE